LTAIGGGIDISADATHIEYLASKEVPSKSELKVIEDGAANFPVQGAYAYCDEFGEYECRFFRLTYDTKVAEFVAGPLMYMHCATPPAVPPKEPASTRVLKRCKQPEEREQAAALADANAGKVFPPFTPMPTSLYTPLYK
jgi:hypothetical protein